MKSELQSAIENLITIARAEAVREFVAAGMATSVVVVKAKAGRKPRVKAAVKPVKVAKAKAATQKITFGLKGQKRSEAEMAGLIGELRAHIEHDPGQSIEAIGKALGKPTKLLALPMKKLISAGDVTVTGNKRATRYHLAETPAAKTNGAAKRVVVAEETVSVEA